MIPLRLSLIHIFFTEPYWSWNREGLEGKDFEIDENGNKQSLTVGMTNDEVIEQRLGGGRFYMAVSYTHLDVYKRPASTAAAS